MNVRKWFVGIIIGLALFGLGSRLIREPGSLLKEIFVIAVIAVAIIAIYQLIARRRPGYHEGKAFAKAARLSKKRKKTNEFTKAKAASKPLRKRSSAHLTVIEGKKNKKKDRAIF